MTTYPEPTLIFENPELTVRAFSVSEMDNSVYLITMRATGEQVLIDPAADAEELYAFTLDALLNDCPQLELADGEERRVRVMEKEEDFNSIRIRAIKELDHLTGAVTSAGAADAAAIKEQEDYTVEEELTGGESFDFYLSDTVIRALHVPGHTPGSIVYTLKTPWEDGTPATLLFTGDTLFPGGVGKTDSPQQFGELFSNVLEKLFGGFEDDAIVLPGHGRSTTLGDERPHLEDWGTRGW